MLRVSIKDIYTDLRHKVSTQKNNLSNKTSYTILKI